ncbi:hypothetical protein Zmor_016290 [Zophobas morio]|uniref:Cytosol aminopeptidase domain-containing protein n=1 Tax=Zophobas morio TaxID=2755281 RepID=A0AA38HEL2_9CUCU|nr:hypothetical protein Zmor_016290 [Zophobas morio]
MYEAQEIAMFLSDMDSNDDGSPAGFIEKVKGILKVENSKIDIEVFNKQKLQELNLNLILAVNRGSAREPFMLKLSLNNDSSSKDRITVIGKGITFDSGGYALKNNDGNRTMRLDKCGGGNSFAIIRACEKLSAKVNIDVLIPLTENLIGPNAVLPSQVITNLTGMSVQIDNPDAEGRLVLADAIAYAEKFIKPKTIIEMSTLTGAITITLGKYMAGMFSTCATLAQELKSKTDEVGDET